MLDNFTHNSILIMNEALSEKDRTISYWKIKAQELAEASKRCLHCAEEISKFISDHNDFKCLKCDGIEATEKLSREYVRRK